MAVRSRPPTFGGAELRRTSPLLKIKKTLSEKGDPGTGLQVLFEFRSAILAGKANSGPQPPRFERGSGTDGTLVMVCQTLADVLGQTNVIPAGVRDGNHDVDIMHGLGLKGTVKRVRSKVTTQYESVMYIDFASDMNESALRRFAAELDTEPIHNLLHGSMGENLDTVSDDFRHANEAANFAVLFCLFGHWVSIRLVDGERPKRLR
jgi:hypothetical protein